MDAGLKLTDLPALAYPGMDAALVEPARIPDLAVVAERFLSPQELEQLCALGSPKRRREWLAARICLKSMLLRRGLIADPTSCRIAKDHWGRPSVVDPRGLPIPGLGDCSLSHKGHLAGALICRLPSVRIGIDIEKISSRLHRITNSFVNKFDIRALEESTDADLAVLWTLKEAYSKAMGLGIGIGFSDLVCDRDPATGTLRIRTQTDGWGHARRVVYKGYAIGVCSIDQSLSPRRRPTQQIDL